MIRRSIYCLLLCMPLFASAQKKDKNAMKAAATITAEDMQKHLYTIAGKEMEGRGTGTPGLEKAALYIETQFKSLGLLPGNKDSYQYYYPLWQDSLEQASIVVDDMTFSPGKDFNLNLRSATSQSLKGNEIVFVGYGIDDPAYSDYKQIDVKGKIVMITEGEPRLNDTAYIISGTSRRSAWGFNVSQKLTAAVKNGATAVLIIQSNFPKYNPDRKPVRGPLYPASQATTRSVITQYNISDTVAAAIMGKAALDEVKAKIKAGQQVSAQSFNKNIEMSCSLKKFNATTSNVVAMLPGTDLKDQYVLITAHMDHLGKRDTVIYYGADDDGSGSTSVLELAQAFAEAKKAGNGPRRTIVFMTVSGEEQGLWGSEFYASNPLFPLEKTSVDLNIDMIGRTGNDYMKDKDSTNYVYVIGDDKLSSDLAPITNHVNDTYMKLKLDRKYNDPNDPNRFYFRSDHYSFAEKGVPIIFYFNGVHPDYHRPTDTPDKINYPMMAQRAQLVFYTAWEMANRNEMLKRDIKLEKPKGF